MTKYEIHDAVGHVSHGYLILELLACPLINFDLPRHKLYNNYPHFFRNKSSKTGGILSLTIHVWNRSYGWTTKAKSIQKQKSWLKPKYLTFMSASVDENHAPSSHGNTQANPLSFQEWSSLEISLQLGQLDSLNLIFESIFEIKLEYLKQQIYVMRIYFLLSFSFEFRNRFRIPSFIRRNKGTNTIAKHHNHHSQVILE